MKKIYIMLICTAAAVLIIYMFIANTYEAPSIADIKVVLRTDIRIKLDCEIQTFKDVNGVESYPIMYNEEIYIPVSFIETASGQKVRCYSSENVAIGTSVSKEQVNDTNSSDQKLNSDIAATLRPDIIIKIGGKIQSYNDIKGVPAYPILYNGTIYITVRLAGAILNEDVNWDSSEETVYIGQYLTYIQTVGKRVNYIDLFDNCIRPNGKEETLESMDPYENQRKSVCYDSVELKFPLLIETDNNGNKNIIYDMYFQKGERYYQGDIKYNDPNASSGYYLVIRKNQCSLFSPNKFGNYNGL